MVDKSIYIVQGEITTVVNAIKRSSRWNTHNPLDDEQDPLLGSFCQLKEVLNSITKLSEVEANVFLGPFLEVIRSEDTTGPITGLSLSSVNKFLSYGLIDPAHDGAAAAAENMADAITHARFVGTDPASDEVVLMKILQVLRMLLLTPVGSHLTNESVCEIMQSCFRICFESRLSELLRKSAEHTLVDMVQLLFARLPEFKEESKSFIVTNMKKAYTVLWKNKRVQLKMRAGGMVDQKWKKQKRSPRASRHAATAGSTGKGSGGGGGAGGSASSNSSTGSGSSRLPSGQPCVDSRAREQAQGSLSDAGMPSPSEQPACDSASELTADHTSSQESVGAGLPRCPSDPSLAYSEQASSPDTPLSGEDPASLAMDSGRGGSEEASRDDPPPSPRRGLGDVLVSDRCLLNSAAAADDRRLGNHAGAREIGEEEGRGQQHEQQQEADMLEQDRTSADVVSEQCPDDAADTSGGGKGHFLSRETIPEDSEGQESPCEPPLHEGRDLDYVNPRGVRFTNFSQSAPSKENHTGGTTVLLPYGLPCVRELFRFLVSLTNLYDRHNSDVMVHMGLQLLTVAMETAHESVAHYASLLALVQDDLCRHLIQLLGMERLGLFAASLRVCLLLFESMREHLKFQLEMYLKKLMDVITSESPRLPYEMKEMALEAVVQLWRIPGLVTELYINYDCDFYCSNLFEELTKLLSKNAFPITGQLYTTHLLSLEALLTVINSIEAHCQPRATSSSAAKAGELSEPSTTDAAGKPCGDLETFVANAERKEVTGTPQPPTSGHLMASRMKSAAHTPTDASKPEKKPPKKPARFSSCLPTPQELAQIKTKKKLLMKGTEKFNVKPKTGIEFLQENKLLATPMDCTEVARWLRDNPRLDKKMIGEFVSDRKHKELLSAFVKTFTFETLRIDESLRLYLEAFRLSGEAPVIHRLLEAFTDQWHVMNGSPFVNNDACFALAYAVIMLNTDQHNHNVRKQNVPMTLEEFKKNLKGVNGSKDFEQDMLEEIYNAIRNDEIVMPEEHTGLVRDNYMWNLLLHRGVSQEGLFLHVPGGAYHLDLFTMSWGPTIAALSFVFDKSTDETIIQKAISGFRKCAMISAYYGLSDVFDNLIISLCKFTMLSNESVDNLPVMFGSNPKAQLSAKTVFNLAHRHGDILREGWKNIMDSMLQIFRAKLLPKSMVEVEDFVDPNGRISILREESPSQRSDSTMFSFVNWLTLSGPEQSGQRGPSAEDQEFKKIAMKCIEECHPEQLLTESRFLRLESLQELMKALSSMSMEDEGYDEEAAVFYLEMLLQIILQNKDRVGCLWQTVRDHLYQLIVHASEHCFLLERAVVGLLRLAIRLLRREENSTQVLHSLRVLLLMKPAVLAKASRQIAFGLHELLKTNAANIHSQEDWSTLFTLLECIGAGAKPPSSLQYMAGVEVADSGAQSDSELPSHQPNGVTSDRGYTSDTEVYTEHNKPARMHRSTTDLDISGSGWLLVGKDDVEGGGGGAGGGGGGGRPSPLVNQYSLSLGQELGAHDTKSLTKCVESLSFIVRDAAHVTPDNFPLCVRAIRIFVEASLNGGIKGSDKKTKTHKYEKPSRLKKKGKDRDGGGGRRGNGGGGRSVHKGAAHSDDDDDEDESVPASYHTVSLQVSHHLLDLMHTLHTRAASIYSSWAEEQVRQEAATPTADAAETAAQRTGGRLAKHAVVQADASTLWASCWCPLLQGTARLCCDARRQVRTQALTYLQRALLMHDLQTLSALEWEACFNKVLFPLLTKLLENISPADQTGMEETRMRTSTLLSKVFLQHLSPLLSLPTFAALWLTILDFMDKYMHADNSDLLMEAIPESLKNMLLVMDTAGIFQNAEARTGFSQLWEITWERIDCFLPQLRDELFRQPVIPESAARAPSPPVVLEVVSSQPVTSTGGHSTPEPSNTVAAAAAAASATAPVAPATEPERPSAATGSTTATPVPSPASSPARVGGSGGRAGGSPAGEVSHALSQSPFILQPPLPALGPTLQEALPPMALPIILNPALIEATSPVPLLAAPRGVSVAETAAMPKALTGEAE
uniref:Golgi-specific brefeldin A-resistance guanine nucleotide exchange factor 1 isoform X1 n=1 Tax=Petromyzon marinus TaxID=7757 RepID=A0AAJ7SUG0_PETMA|nr:Golgi-specific brefeldin A-resistance guanine nucleotide exchange factor 1 isoform X1 [Petromyzon marinus]XP_032805809.1 Golgi-specific brefeldin A-resistance guanine nucleotide exchange factor 1 isoform X1 [Petromyzon marinus]XP_032805810.1 Golgi-specific brefeldin A-resistance guanine nucleotide exchange factor 1 isoform X1 [Petromyzon marinus]XP_032805811.1 Golgi-specific brefeldin A-resistance guanine nucleotide exchange factor 1 isoform X1 [Petromyzon marinus]